MRCLLLLGILTLAEPSTVRVRMDRVRTLPWDEYLARVVEREAGPGFPQEALKAQAVVARTYALHRIGRARFQGDRYDVEAGTLGQALSEAGVSEPCRSAVEETRGLVLEAGGHPVEAFFHAICGGRTARPQDVFHAESPGLSAVRCPYCRGARSFEWGGGLSRAFLARLGREAGLPGLVGFRPSRQDPWGRVLAVRGTGPGTRPEIPLTVLRRLAGERALRGGVFRPAQAASHILFRGRGYGHGVGLCQEGARELAGRGRDFRRILRHYFPEAELSHVPSP